MKISRAEKIGAVGFLLMAFFAAAMDSDNMLIPAAGVLFGAFTMGVATWLSFHRL